MHRRITALLIVSALWLTAGAQVKTRRPDPHAQTKQEVLKVHQQITDASIKNDYKTLDGLLSDNWIGTDDRGQTLMEKFTSLAAMKAGAFKTHEHKETALRVTLDGDQAIVSGVAVTRGEREGQSIKTRIRFEDVYEKRDGRWRGVRSKIIEMELTD